MKKERQLIFIDDSGDPGFKIDRGASRMFVIVCVVFANYVDADFASMQLEMLKKKLDWKQEREFKFHRATDVQKEEFFKTLKSLKFRIYATIVDKFFIIEPNLKPSDSFYEKIILNTLTYIDNMQEAYIFLDGKAGKNYRNRSVAKIRQALNKNTHCMTRFKMVDSKNDILVQLADMIAGCIRVKFDPSKSVKTDLLEIIHDKIAQLYFYEN